MLMNSWLLRMLTYSYTSAVPRLVTSQRVRPAAVTLLGNRQLDTLALGQRDPWLLLSNDAAQPVSLCPHTSARTENLHNVGLTSAELVVNSVLDVDNVEASVVALTVRDDTNTTHVTTTSHHDNDTSVELDEVGNLASGQVHLDSVVDLDRGVGVADPTQPFSSNFFLDIAEPWSYALVTEVSLLQT